MKVLEGHIFYQKEKIIMELCSQKNKPHPQLIDWGGVQGSIYSSSLMCATIDDHVNDWGILHGFKKK